MKKMGGGGMPGGRKARRASKGMKGNPFAGGDMPDIGDLESMLGGGQFPTPIRLEISESVDLRRKRTRLGRTVGIGAGHR